MDVIKKNNDYQHLVNQISKTYLQGQKKAVVAINKYHLDTYWQIGQYIVEFEQGGKAKAEYGKGLIENLSKDLSLLHGRGFSLSNLKRMRQFYLVYPISAKPSHQLSWSHYVELLKIDDELERSFYEKQSLLENWSIPELMRQKKSSLFLRLAASKDKDELLVKYAMHNISSQLFVSKYQLYLPNREELRALRALIERQLNLSDDNVSN